MQRSAEAAPQAEEPPQADEPREPDNALLDGPARRPMDRLGAGEAIPGVVRAVIVGAGEDGRPLVTWSGSGGARAPTVAEPVWMQNPPRWADCAGLDVIVGFEDGDPGRPLLLGLLGKPPSLDDASALQVSRIESGDELVLQCGEARITLRADGTITIRGAKVVSRARGVNKIKGGSVEIN